LAGGDEIDGAAPTIRLPEEFVTSVTVESEEWALTENALVAAGVDPVVDSVSVVLVVAFFATFTVGAAKEAVTPAGRVVITDRVTSIGLLAPVPVTVTV
jgi:hypothetical protein